MNTNKIDLIKAEVARIQLYTQSETLKQVLEYIDKVQEEPVSEDLDKAVVEYMSQFSGENYYNSPWVMDSTWMAMPKELARFGAKWQKNHLWKPADGDDLPEYDREVIAILAYDFGHYKVVYAHRPNPNGWNGTNIDTGEEEYFEPATYGKGGWNQPHVLYWLDARLPYEENKIIKEL